MGKVIPFTKIKKNTSAQKESATVAVGFDRIHAILNDDSLSAAERNWILENMLMQIDEQLEQHKREVEKAERKLHDLVQAAEQEIASASRELKGKKLSTFAKATANRLPFAKATADRFTFDKAMADKFRT